MKRLSILILLILATHINYAQRANKDLVNELNKQITLYSADNASLLQFYETNGTLEQTLNDHSYQRIKLEGISALKVEANAIGYSVKLQCADSFHCIHIIKNNMAGSPMPSNAFLFTDAKSANTFAKVAEELILKYASSANQVKLELINIDSKTSHSSKKIISGEHGQVNEDEKNEPNNRANSKSVKSEEENEDEVAETVLPKVKSTKKKTKNELNGEDEINHEKDADRDPFPATETSNNDNFIETVCKQLMSIIQAGKKSYFKEIEGKESNPTTKINESKIKLKGTKRSYLSWYKKERAFIGEYKSTKDRELILIEFDRIQTELEDCLEAGWDNIDHSQDPMYDTLKDEVKDVEYVNNADPKLPALRIMINTDTKGMHTLFIRIQ